MSLSLKRLENLYHRLIPDALTISPIWLDLDKQFHIKIDSVTTLQLFTDIFVNQQYAPAFDLLDSPEVIVDLGANRGLFLVYSCYTLNKKKKLENVRFYCVEPAHENFQILMEHISRNNLTDIVETIRGAVVGKRSGTVPFYYLSKFHVAGKVAQGSRLTTRKVPVINLADYIADNQTIDLLKVDIEGSEQAFIEEYQDILQKTKVLIVEFHLPYIDYHASRTILLRNGFVQHKLAYEFNENLIVEIFINKGS